MSCRDGHSMSQCFVSLMRRQEMGLIEDLFQLNTALVPLALLARRKYIISAAHIPYCKNIAI